MRDEAVKDVWKVWVYAAASAILGAWIAPWLYNAGKALAEVSENKRTNGPLDALARLCRSTDFTGVFEASLVAAALLLFFPFVEWLRVGHGGPGRHGDTPWSIRLPEGATGSARGQRLRKNDRAWLHAAGGFLLTAGLFLLLGYALVRTGAFEWRAAADGLGKTYLRVLAGAAVMAALQELLFRGIAMGIFLRAVPVAAAIGMSALLFGAVHFLNPPPGLSVADPDAAGVGFELLRRVLARWVDWRVLVTGFAPLLAMGAVLGYARWRTASLWLPIGLHAGWAVATALFGRLATGTSARGDSLLAGASLGEGLIPLICALTIGVLVRFFAAADEETPGIPA